MFTLRIHSVDFPQSLFTTIAITPTSSSSADHNPNPNDNHLNPAELRGISHLFRHIPPSTTAASSLSNPTARTTTLFVIAVPNYLSPDDFVLFCGSHINYFTELLFLRNDGMEDRYSVLIRLVNQLTADGFYCSFNGKRFRPSEAEVCHMYFTQSVEYTELADIASTPPPGFAELPTCPICLERLDHDTSGIQSTLCDHSFHCSCISKWTYLSCQVCRLCQQQDDKPTCAVCGTLKNLWICLICGFVGCGRYEKGHAIRHWSDTQHSYSLELESQQIWDYVGDKYVHRLNQSKADAKSMKMNSCPLSADGECGTCVYDEESGLDGALFNSKFEAVVEEYNHLLASQLEIQRQHYESLLAEAKSGKEMSVSKAVEKAVFSRMQDIQGMLENSIREKKCVEDMIEDCTKNQDVLQKKFKEIELRECLSLKSRDEKILDLEEQIRDIKIYVGAQRTLANATESDSIKGGTVLPLQSSSQSSPGNPKRRMKSSRRRN